MNDEIIYLGDDLIIERDNCYKGCQMLTNGKKYKLEYPITKYSEMNGFYVLYIYDDYGDDESRGYELRSTDIKIVTREDKLKRLF